MGKVVSMLMDVDQLFERLKAGELMEAKKELLLYGTIVNDREWQTSKGFHRVYEIGHYSRRFHIAMTNGDVIGISINGRTYN